ncbi:hypothetical protein ACFFQW_47940 [Umezawaea endophytica]|uniref:Uncharacterized protein n=1 Tax=Umezawaea endophytica TaxID=1654476 RepID=A0A9X2VWR7_9PSEU|nr:hypothetical protein [Umezawaea endophytica]MCS7483504.1 hypothetical protein [Umezawaea endophytica]
MRKMMAAVLTAAALVGLAGTASAQAEYPWPPADITPVHKTKAELQEQADRFTAHELESFPRIFPGAQDITAWTWGHEAAGLFDDMQYMNNAVKFTYQGRRVTVYPQIHAPGHYPITPKQLCERDKCTGERRDHRGGIVVFTELDEFGIRVATNFRPNGEVVWAQGTTADEPAQLAAVAVDRAYTFTR